MIIENFKSQDDFLVESLYFYPSFSNGVEILKFYNELKNIKFCVNIDNFLIFATFTNSRTFTDQNR